jgi:hypothetical protein
MLKNSKIPELIWELGLDTPDRDIEKINFLKKERGSSRASRDGFGDLFVLDRPLTLIGINRFLRCELPVNPSAKSQTSLT